MTSSFYDKEHVHHFGQIKNYAPEQMKAFAEFNSKVFKEGALSIREKEIVAVAIAHVTECPYCIDSHTKKAKAAGATLEELTEAVFVVAGIEAGGVVTHSTHVHNAKDPEAEDNLYARSNLKQLGNLGKYAEEGFKGYSNFSATAMKVGELSAKFKEIIAVAVAHATQCPYCIDVHSRNADKLGATNEELAEAIMVTAALKAGGAYAHLVNMIQSFNE